MQANIIEKSDNLSQNSWLNMRKQGIEGSDAAAICGLSRWRSPMDVWLEKTGNKEPKGQGNRLIGSK